MKLLIFIPCLNEAETLPLVLKTIPKHIDGIDTIETVIIDDGSTDATIAVAEKLGVTHIVRHHGNQGLAQSFRDGLWFCLQQRADIIVNTDGDNQYPSESIPALIAPILNHTADLVIADRQTDKIEHFSPLKKVLQRLGTKVLNKAAGTDIPDAPSGFRAYSRSAALRLNPVTRFSYAMETLVQAGNKGIAITSIPITTNPKTRESRLFKNNAEHIFKSMAAISRAYIMYRPYAVFLSLSAFLLLLGLLPFIRFLYFVQTEGGARHLQSLIFGVVFVTAALVSLTLGVIADLIRINRKLIEDNLELTKAQLLSHHQR